MTGEVKLARPGEPEKGDHFASLLTTIHMKLLDPEAPMDYFSPTQHANIQNQTCPVCKKYFPNKTHMLNHKRALHKYVRAKLDSEYVKHLESVSNEVALVADKDGDQFCCIMADGSIDFHELPANHEKVLEYFELKEKHYCGQLISDVKNWVARK